MKTYHYSVLFLNSEIPHHGTFETVFTESSQVKEKAKKFMALKLTTWKKNASDITSFEVYDNDRKIIFKWKS